MGWTVSRAPSSPPFDFYSTIQTYNRPTVWFDLLSCELRHVIIHSAKSGLIMDELTAQALI
jgi:hypothetical protein